jgi:hypothetical protein
MNGELERIWKEVVNGILLEGLRKVSRKHRTADDLDGI